MTKEAIAKRLRQARLAKGMSQQEVGSALTPPQRRHEISRYERNGATPNVITIAQLAAALGVTPCWLAFGAVCPRSAVGCGLNAVEQRYAK